MKCDKGKGKGAGKGVERVSRNKRRTLVATSAKQEMSSSKDGGGDTKLTSEL